MTSSKQYTVSTDGSQITLRLEGKGGKTLPLTMGQQQAVHMQQILTEALGAAHHNRIVADNGSMAHPVARCSAAREIKSHDYGIDPQQRAVVLLTIFTNGDMDAMAIPEAEAPRVIEGLRKRLEILGSVTGGTRQ